MSTHYDTLGVAQSASAKDIRKAYLRRARALHPDRQLERSDVEARRAEEAMRMVNAAWDVLGNPKKKADYDQSIRASGSRPARKRQATTRPPQQPRQNPTRPATSSTPNYTRSNPSTSRPIDEQGGDGSVSIWASIPVLILIGVLVGVFVVVTFVDGDRDNRPVITNPELSAGDCFVLVGNTPREVECESGNAVGQVTEVGPDPGNCPDTEQLPLQDPESDFFLCWARMVPGSSVTVPG